MARPEEQNNPNNNDNGVDLNTGTEVVSTAGAPKDDISADDVYVKKVPTASDTKPVSEDTSKNTNSKGETNQKKNDEKETGTQKSNKNKGKGEVVKTNNKKSDVGEKDSKEDSDKASDTKQGEGRKKSDAVIAPTISEPTEPAPKTVESDKAPSPFKPNTTPTPQETKPLPVVSVEARPSSDTKPEDKQSEAHKQPTEKQQQDNSKQADNSNQTEGANTEPGFLDKAGTIASMIGKGWWESDKDIYNGGLFDAGASTYKGTGTATERTFVGDAHDFESLHKDFNDSLAKYDQSDFVDRKEPHKVSGMPICTENGLMTCAMGTVFSKLRIIDPTRKTILGKCPKNRCAVITDCVPGVNFDGFGPCWNILNPAVLAATTAASIAAGHFVLTPMPCVATMMPSPWLPLAPNVLVNKQPILLDKSISNCWGLGFITFQECGQGLGPETHYFTDDAGNPNLHLIFAMAANVVASVATGGFAIAGRVAEAAAAARAAQAIAMGARGAEMAASAAKWMKFAKVASNVSKVGDVTANAIMMIDGGLYISEGDYVSGALNMIPGAAGAVLDIRGEVKASRAAQQAAAFNENFIKTLDPNVQGPFRDIMKQSGDVDFVKKIIKENPDIYGDVSKLPDADLEALIKGSNPYVNAEKNAQTASRGADAANAATGAANTRHTEAKAAKATADSNVKTTAAAVVDARAQAQASSNAATKAQADLDAFEAAGKKANEATEDYVKALKKQDAIQAEIDRLTEKASKLDPKSREYAAIQRQIQSERYKMPAAKREVEAAKNGMDDAASAYADMQQSIKKEYGVDTVEDMEKVAKEKQATATSDAQLANDLESDLDKFIDTQIEQEGKVTKTEKEAAQAQSNSDNWAAISNEADANVSQQHALADSAATADQAANAAAPDGWDKTWNWVNPVVGTGVKPVAGDYNTVSDESVNAYDGKNPYVLTDEEKKMLDELGIEHE